MKIVHLFENQRYEFYSDCVNWPREDAEGLEEIIDSGEEISFEQFRNVIGDDLYNELETMLGYDEEMKHSGLTLENDYATSANVGKLRGQTIYFVVHSGIEYVFVPQDF